MPAVSLSTIVAEAARAAGGPLAGQVAPGVPCDLLEALEAVADPRRPRGVRHRLALVLGIALCATLAGAKSYVAIGEWAHDLPLVVRERLGMVRRPPCESTIRRTTQAVDPAALQAVFCGWLARSAAPGARWRGVAVDGKAVRGARRKDGRAARLLAAVEHADGVVLAQRAVDGKSNEITAFAPLLDDVADLIGVIVTADAMHTQRDHANYLAGRGAHYVLVAKDNQPRLLAQLKSLPWRDIDPAEVTVGKGHGRVESRTVKLAAYTGGLRFPNATTAIQIIRRRKALHARKWSIETVYAITDLDQTQISPQELAGIIRGHWHIENKLHWVRDVTFGEDLSQIRTGHGPIVMAALRNLAISIHRRHGATNIAAATRAVSRQPTRVVPLIQPAKINTG